MLMSWFRRIIQKLNTSGSLSGSDYSPTRIEYYRNFVFPVTPGDFENIINPQSPIIIEKVKSFQIEIDYGMNYKEIVKTIGKPNFSLQQNFSNLKYRILFYKLLINGQKVIRQIHQIDNKYFFSCHTFHQIVETEIKKIKGIILNKYIENFSDDKELIILKDSSENKMLIKDNIHLRIANLTGNPVLIENLNKMIKLSSIIETKQEKRELAIIFSSF